MTERPQSLTDRPLAAASELVRSDPLSAVLALVRTRGELLCRSEFSAPFGLAFPGGPVHFHAVESGSVWVRSALDEAPTRIAAGAYLLFPRGDGHILSSGRDTPATPLAEAVRDRTDADRARHAFVFGGDGDPAHLTCLRFAYDNPLAERWLEALPRVVVIPAQRRDGRHSLATTVAALLDEVDQPGPGSAIMVARLIDLVFIQMLRMWVAEHPNETGWLAGAADARVGRALAAIHGAPNRPWTVTELAQRAGLARSAFNARFLAIVGKPPATYVLEWRLNLAADRLHGTREPVNKIARDLGYGSEAAFSRAFKARFGMSPTTFRAGLAERSPR